MKMMLMTMLFLAAAADDVVKAYKTDESHERQLSAQDPSPTGLHLSGSNAKIIFGPDGECEFKYNPGPPASLESTCPIAAPPPAPQSAPTSPLTPPWMSHEWDFRSCSGDIADSQNPALIAKPVGEPTCSSEGAVLDGLGSYYTFDTGFEVNLRCLLLPPPGSPSPSPAVH